jgi:capsule polysaccharide export protein KpsE/RkpR
MGGSSDLANEETYTDKDLKIRGPKSQWEISETVTMPPLVDVAPDTRADELLEWLRLVWRERQFVFRVTALGLILATLLAFLIPKRYDSTTRLMPPDSQSSAGMSMLAALTAKGGAVGAGLASYGGNLLGATSSGDLFIGILGSRSVQDRLVDRFDLKKVYGVRLKEDARKSLSVHTSISADRKSGIISITVTDQDPNRAAEIGRAYVEELNHLVVELNTSKAHRERVFLEERLKTVQQDLQSAEQDFSQFASRNMAIDIKEQGKAMVEAAAALQGELIAAQSELEGLRQIYTDNNVRVRSVEARVAELKRQLEKIGGKGAADASPSTSAHSLYPSISELPLLGVTYADMYRRTKVQEATYEALTQEYELAKVEEVKELPSVKLLDPSEVPERKSFPPRFWILVVGTLLSFLLSIAWIFGVTTWKRLDSRHPTKIVFAGVLTGVRSELTHASENGSRFGWVVRKARALPWHQNTTQDLDSSADRDPSENGK